MTLADMLATLERQTALPASRMKDMKTSVRYLAAALGAASPEECTLDTTCLDPATWGPALETHFEALTAQGRTISAMTRRNTRNNLRVLLRQAEAQGLFATPLPSPLLAKSNLTAWRRAQLATNPYPQTYRGSRNSYTLPRAQWPPQIQEAWRDYRRRCGLRIRETSFQAYETQMRMYLGYLIRVCGHTPTLDDLFDVAQLTEFVRWHGARMGRAVSVQGRQVAIMIATMAKVLDHPAQHGLADVRRGLPKPAAIHNKQKHWVSLATLEQVAAKCFAEGRAPIITGGHVSRFPGAQRAGRFGRGLMLKLLVRVPLRQRNVREMQLDRHLWQETATGHWHLEFRGDELKVGNRGPKVNTYHVDLTEYCPDFLPWLDEWLTVHRPKLPNATTSRFVFLTQHGKPHSMKSLHLDLSEAVCMYTGQRFYPHLVRSIWATEYLEKTNDFAAVATMLGDTIKTVMELYYEVVEKDQHAKAKAFLSTALHAG